jgi:TolB-like protein/class 3 adenylate cyclase/Flp pilus assembly protein TadD
LTLVFTDLADSTALKTRSGDQAIAELIARHRAHVQRLAVECNGHVVSWAGDGGFLTFEMPSAAVRFALLLQQVHADEHDLPGVRIGIHMGEVSERSGSEDDVEGLAVDLASRIVGLARPAQVLTSASVADSARSRIDPTTFGRPIRWQAHGRYRLKGCDEPLEIREVGVEGVAPFAVPAMSDKAVRLEPAHLPAAPRWTRVAAIGLVLAITGAAAYLVHSPVHAHLAGAPGAAPTAPSGDGLAIPAFAGRPAIAVLPLDNLSPDPEQAFFADGLAEDLITRLSAWRAFPVIARNSSFQYRGGNLDLKRVSAELGARYLVEGSVRRAGDRIRVTAQLIDAPSGKHVWAETYDREVKDVFAVQDEISSTIAATIAGDVSRVEAERAQRRGTENLEAWSLYEMGLQRSYHYTRADNAEARRMLERALEIDPGFATALANLSFTYSWEVNLGSDAPEQATAVALATARRAIDLDPREPLAHAALCDAFLVAGDVRSGLDAAQRAVELNPSMPEAWIELGWAQLLSGDPDGCITSNKKARRLNPQGEMTTLAWDNMALAYWETGRFDASLDAARRLVAAQPDYWWGQLYLALNAVSLGHPDEARAAIAEARRLQPDLSLAQIQRGFGVSRPAADARRNAALREAGLE